ncbi:MAG: YraN family protein [Clostridia bacterium]|nr:YraN family protein [Clostridia bacterium]
MKRKSFKKRLKLRFERAKTDLAWFFDIKPKEKKRENLTEKQTIGAIGEAAALDYLLKKGYFLLEKNWRHSHSEIDLIMRDGRCVVFCEVRSQNLDKTNYLSPAESLRREKLESIASGAAFYMGGYRECHNPYIKTTPPSRFDAVEVWIRDGKAVKINHLTDIYIKRKRGFQK